MPYTLRQNTHLSWAWALLALVILRTLLLISAAWPFSTDDAFISIHYSQNLASGAGLVWNAGEAPVEGFTNFLYVVIGAAAIVAGVEPVLILKLVGATSLLGTCMVLFLLARRWVSPLAAVLPAALLTAYSGTIWWTVSGLETALFQFFLSAAVLLFAVAGQRTLYLLAAGFVVFLSSITRIEGPVIGVALAVGTLARALQSPDPLRTFLRIALPLAAGFVLPYAAYFGWRFEHFGRLWPNTVYCKVGNPEDPWQLLRNHWELTWPFALLGVFALKRKPDPALISMAAGVVLFSVLLYNVDPIIAHRNRHFMGIMGLQLVLGVCGAYWLMQGFLTRFAKQNWMPVFVAVLVLATTVPALVAKPKLQRSAENYEKRGQSRERLADWLNTHVPTGSDVAIGDVGVVSTLFKGPIVDLLCLNNAQATRPPIGRSDGKLAEAVLTSVPAPGAFVLTSPSAVEYKPQFNIYAEIIQHPNFARHYFPDTVIGHKSFQYWVFLRRDALPRHEPSPQDLMRRAVLASAFARSSQQSVKASVRTD